PDAPGAPRISTVTQPVEVSTTDALNLSWIDATPAPTQTQDRTAEGFHLFRATTTNAADFKLVQTIVPATSTVVDTVLAPNTTYFYKVSGFNRLGDGALSAIASGATRPQRPMNVQFQAVYSSSITVSWNSDHEVGSAFKVDLADAADFKNIVQSTTVLK